MVLFLMQLVTSFVKSFFSKIHKLKLLRVSTPSRIEPLDESGIYDESHRINTYGNTWLRLHSKYSHASERLKTFEDWPIALFQKP